MVQGGGGLHHLHKRKRIHHHHEEYPHPNRWKAILDNVLLVLAGAWPAATLPQVLEVFWFKDASGLSFFSWFLYVFFTIPWIIYGALHKVKLITFAYTFNFLLYSAVLIGIIIYG